MRQSAAVWCDDNRSLQTLGTSLEELEMQLVHCSSGQEALELVMNGRCSTLIVDFDLPGAQEVVRMAALLPPGPEARIAGGGEPRLAGHRAGLPIGREPHLVPATG